VIGISEIYNIRKNLWISKNIMLPISENIDRNDFTDEKKGEENR